MATSPVMSIVEPYTPELLDSAQEYIQNYVRGRGITNVLEFGSGWSTIWFARMGCFIFSVEHSQDWYTEVVKKLDELRIRNRTIVDLVQPKDYEKYLTQHVNKSMHILYIDCIDEYRVSVTQQALRLLKKGGILILDDTHWALWNPILRHLWNNEEYKLEEIFEGMHVRKDGEKHYHRTTIYKRTGVDI